MTITRKTFDEVMIPCYKPMDMLIVKGHGSCLYASNGSKYLDLTGGVAVNCLGHTHKGVRRVIKKQSARLMHVSNIFANRTTLKTAARLTALTGFEKVLFVNSGTEANEAALKLARRAALEKYGEQKNEIISFSRSFHGRTFFAVCVAAQDKYSDGFGPKPGAITHVEFNNPAALENVISDRTCAVILEPLQGEGGVIAAHPDFLVKVKELCARHHALLIFDEVQTGVGRTGTLYAYMQTPVIPDILTSAKGLAAGLPMGAVLTSSEIAAHFGPGTHGCTFGGNALCCAVSSYVLDKISRESFLYKVRYKSAYLMDALSRLAQKYKVFSEIRGKGLLIGCVMTGRYANQSAALQAVCARHRLLVLVAGPDVLRLAPALNIKMRDLEKAVNRLDEALYEFTGGKTAAPGDGKDEAGGEKATAAAAETGAATDANSAAGQDTLPGKASKAAEEKSGKSKDDKESGAGKDHKDKDGKEGKEHHKDKESRDKENREGRAGKDKAEKAG